MLGAKRATPAEAVLYLGSLHERLTLIALKGAEYLEAADGRLIFYDVNANSNLRLPIGHAFGFDPFERVVDYLMGQIALTRNAG